MLLYMRLTLNIQIICIGTGVVFVWSM